MEQRSPEWFAARCGKVTASRVADLMAKTKSGYSTSRANYMAELICERLTGKPTEGYTNGAMQWGTDTEPQAKAAYVFMHDAVAECAFAEHATIGSFGASPDGLVGDDGLVEIKCPNTATHLEFLLSKTIPGKYITQMQTQMACTGRKWCDFVSFDPRLPDSMQMWISRVNRDDAAISEIEKEVVTFLAEVEAKIAALNTDYGMAA
jgi:putative phage-type endonuclease